MTTAMTATKKAIREYAWPRFVYTVGVGLAVLGAYVGLRQFGPSIEERWFPILSDAHVYDTMVGSDGSFLFRYTFVKHRDCDLKNYAWYYVDKDVIGPADITRSGQTPSRPVGVNLSVWWKVGVGERLPGKYFIDLEYDCGWPWTSRSLLSFDLARPLDGDHRELYQ